MNPLHQATAVAIAFFLIGVGLLVAAANQFMGIRTFVRTAITAPGRVVDLEYREYRSGLRGSSGGGYVTVFTFSDASGMAHTVRTASAQNPATHKVGEEVLVLYHAGPEDARIRSFQTLWIIPTFLACFGCAFAGVGSLAYVAARRTYGKAA